MLEYSSPHGAARVWPTPPSVPPLGLPHAASVDVARADRPREAAARRAASGSRTSRPTSPASARTWRPVCSAASSWSRRISRRHRADRRSHRSLRDNPDIDRIRCARCSRARPLRRVGLCYGRRATGLRIEMARRRRHRRPVDWRAGTQLTMRTFHTALFAEGGDITAGLPAWSSVRGPHAQGAAVLARISVLSASSRGDGRGHRDLTTEADTYNVTCAPTSRCATAMRSRPRRAGRRPRTRRSFSPQGHPRHPADLWPGAEVYREQGVSIHDKHIELYRAPDLRRVSARNPVTHFLPGERVDSRIYAEVNRHSCREQRPAEGRPSS